ncbi:MAG: glycosyltransferase family 4 protein [Acidimicrobiales bacterium]
MALSPDRRLRLALVHPFWWPEVRRGGERYFADLAWWLASAGHEVDVITGRTRRPPAPEPEGPAPPGSGGPRMIWRPQVLPGPLRRRGVSALDAFGVSALPALARRRYDVVHALTPTAALAGRLCGQRVVYTVLGHPTADQFGRRPLDARLFGAASRRSHAVAALSRASAGQVEAMTGRRAVVLSPGVRTEEFAPALAARAGPARVLFCSDAADPRKGLRVLAEAFGRLLTRHPGARLVLAGPGDPGPALAGTFEPGSPSIEITGPEVDLADCYRRATVTVLPSRHEAFGLVLVESLACGTPVVCFDDGGMPAIVDRPEVGRVARTDDAASLARAIEEAAALAADPSTPGRCAAHSRRWDWRAAIGPHHEALYREVAAGGRRVRPDHGDRSHRPRGRWGER